MLFIQLLFTLVSFASMKNHDLSGDIIGAWKDENGVMIFTEDYFSYASFSPTEFKYTCGGQWSMDNNTINLKYEFHTKSPDKVGTIDSKKALTKNQTLHLDDVSYVRIDDGSPGKLQGAWLFYYRIQDGEPGTPRTADNPRKTMKILSGTRFQWIAYNTETRSFSGTGGGTYITKNGKYTENIDFFSRDNNRVGASLEFDYELKGDEWHHRGLNSRGEPMYEIWKKRSAEE